MLLLLSVSACDDGKDKNATQKNLAVAQTGAQCNGSKEKSLVSYLMRKNLLAQISSDISNQAIYSDTGNMSDAFSSIPVSVNVVVTTKNDLSSTKKYCHAQLDIVIPNQIMENAATVRAEQSLQDPIQKALQANVEFSANTIKAPIDYDVQPTDDGKDIYVNTNKNNAGIILAAQLIEQNLLKISIDKQKAEAVRQQQGLEAAKAAEKNTALENARAGIKAANDEINLVWNAGTAQWRHGLLPEQRAWLTEREKTCKVKALENGTTDSVDYEIGRLNCQIDMTHNRTAVLKSLLQQTLATPPTNQPSYANPLPARPTYTTSFDCTKAKSDAEHLICTDPTLAAADVDLARLYAAARAVVTNRMAFQERVRQQWNYREQVCHDRDCLMRWYNDEKIVMSHIEATGRADAD